MKWEQRLPPDRLAGLGLAASLLPFAAACWAAWPTRYLVHVRQSRQTLLEFLFGFVLPFGLGLWVAYSSLSAVRRAVDEELWLSAVQERLAKRLNSTVASVLAYGLTLFGAGVAFTSLISSRPHTIPGGAFGYFLILPLLTLLKLRRILTPPSLDRRSFWGNAQTLVSDHWGKGPS